MRSIVLQFKYKICKKCGRLVDKHTHHEDWKPSEKQKYYFTEWDVCHSCGFIQQCENNKKYTAEFKPKEPRQKTLL